MFSAVKFIVSLLLISLFPINGYTETTVKVGVDGYYDGKIKLPAPEPQTYESFYETPWPKVVGHKQRTGISRYYEKVTYLDLAVNDINNDGLWDLIYISKDTSHSLTLTIYLQKTFGNFEHATELYFTFKDSFESVRFFISDLNGDKLNDLIFVRRLSVQSIISPQLLVTAFPAAGPLQYDLNNRIESKTDALFPFVFLKEKKNGYIGMLLAQSGLKSPSKKVLSKLFFQKKVTYKFKIVALTKNHFNTIQNGSRDLELKELEHINETVNQLFPNWEVSDQTQILHWEKRIKNNPEITYDWNGDGTKERITIDPARLRHRVFNENDQLVTEFRLSRSSLLTGTYLDLDADRMFDQIDLRYEMNNQVEIAKSTEVKIRHPFETIPAESYLLPGMILFPESFSDADHDGDIDIIAIEPMSVKKNWMSTKIPVTLLLFHRNSEGYQTTPVARKKIRLSAKDTLAPSLADYF